VIDPEFAFYGPMGFDLGAIIGNLLMSYLASAGHERAPGDRRSFEAWILETIERLWAEFSRKFVELWRTEANGDAYPATLFAGEAGAARLETERQSYMERLFRDTVGFSAAKSSAASSALRTILISSGSKTRSVGPFARRGVCAWRAP
jgi:5-methylthioribose kinase